MPEAGWLLLLLFLGCCSLIMVALFWPSYIRSTRTRHHKSEGAQPAPSSHDPPTLPSPDDHIADWIAMLGAALHLLVIGHSRSGKTTVIHELAIRWVAQGHRVIVCDLDAAPGLWSGCEVFGYGNETEMVNGALKNVGKELERRRILRGSGTQRSFPPLYVVIDEYRDVVRHCTSARGLVEDTLRRGGKLDIHLLVGVQDKQVKTMGFEGQGELRRNFTFIIDVRCDRLGRRWATVSDGSDEKSADTYPVPPLPDLDKLVRPGVVPNLSPSQLHLAQNETSLPPLSLAETTRIIRAITQGETTKTNIIKAIPGYSSRRHKAFAALYNHLVEIIQKEQLEALTSTSKNQAAAPGVTPIDPVQSPNGQDILHPKDAPPPQSGG